MVAFSTKPWWLASRGMTKWRETLAMFVPPWRASVYTYLDSTMTVPCCTRILPRLRSCSLLHECLDSMWQSTWANQKGTQLSWKQSLWKSVLCTQLFSRQTVNKPTCRSIEMVQILLWFGGTETILNTIRLCPFTSTDENNSHFCLPALSRSHQRISPLRKECALHFHWVQENSCSKDLQESVHQD